MSEKDEELMANAIVALNNRIRHKRRRSRDPRQKPLFKEEEVI